MEGRNGARFESSALATPANAITVARILATPLMLILILDVGVSWWSVVVWVGVACTDFLDGWVARRQGTTTSGAFLDPLADKILVIGALAALVSAGLVDVVPVAVIAGRELLISVYRSLVARHGVSVPARPLAKLKTATQDLAVGLVLAPTFAGHYLWVGKDVLWVAAGLAVVSGAQYLLDSHSVPDATVAPVGDTQGEVPAP